MKTIKDVERLEKTIGQLDALHREISLLSKKSPSDAVNPFKLKVINTVIETANMVFGTEYVPIDGFSVFEDDEAPSTSDVVLVLAQYIEEAARFRTDHVVRHNHQRFYVLNGQRSSVLADPRARGTE